MARKRISHRRRDQDRDREIPRYGCATGKTGWPTRRGAESALRDAARSGGTRDRGTALNALRTAYHCRECGGWHLTSLAAEESRAVERVKRAAKTASARRNEASSVCSAREWKIRSAAIRLAYGNAENFRPSAEDLETEAARIYAQALEIAAAGGDQRVFWRTIEGGDESARLARFVAEGNQRIAVDCS